MPTPGGMQDMTVINEPGLYKLIFKSRKPEAKSFTRWVTHDVLPSIRKTGSYYLPEASQPQKAPTPYMSRARFNASERIIKAALKCKTEQDFQTVIALDRAFQKRNGYSPLEDAGLRLAKVMDEDCSLFDADWQYYVDDEGILQAWADPESLPHHFVWKHDLPALKVKKEDK